MATFVAEARFSFEASDIKDAGAALRRLSDAAADAGFALDDATVEPAPPDEPDDGWTVYAPLKPPNAD